MDQTSQGSFLLCSAATYFLLGRLSKLLFHRTAFNDDRSRDCRAFSQRRNLFIVRRTKATCQILKRRKLDHDDPLRVPVAEQRSSLATTNQITTVIMLNYGTDIFGVFEVMSFIQNLDLDNCVNRHVKITSWYRRRISG